MKTNLRTLPCHVCGLPFTARIDPKVNLDRGGYVICTDCSNMLPQQRVEKKEIKWKKKEV